MVSHYIEFEPGRELLAPHNGVKGARPNRRLRPDAFEARAEWWVRSREFFDGRIHEAPSIPTPGQSQPKPMEVPEHYGLSDFDFSVLQNTEGLQQDGPKTLTKQSSSSFFDMAQRTPTYPKTFEEPISSRHPTSHHGTPKIATPMPNTRICPMFFLPIRESLRFAPWSSTNQAGPSQNHDVGIVNRVVRNQYVDCMTFLGSPKPVFLDCGIKGFVVEEQFWRDLVPYVCKGASIFWMELMIRDRPPGARYTVAKIGTSAMIEKSNKFVIETDFHLMGMLDGSSRPYPSWDDVDIVHMPINSGGDHWVTGVLNLRWSTIHVIDSLNNPHRKKQLMDHISKWTNVLNVLLEKAGHFERTGRQPYNFELVYNDGLEFASPQQGNSSDCGVVTCWVIESLFMGRAPVLYNVDPNFFFSDFRVQMCLRLYNCRCEDTQECGYD
ncbi:phospholipase-like protein [Tanacetum coccineum]